MIQPKCDRCIHLRPAESTRDIGYCTCADSALVGQAVNRLDWCAWYEPPAPFPPPQSPTGKVCPACGKAITSDGKRTACGCEA